MQKEINLSKKTILEGKSETDSDAKSQNLNPKFPYESNYEKGSVSEPTQESTHDKSQENSPLTHDPKSDDASLSTENKQKKKKLSLKERLANIKEWPKKKKIVVFGSMISIFIIIAGTLGVYLSGMIPGFGPQKKEIPTEDKEVAATLDILSGSVNITRDEKLVTKTESTELYAGDRIKTLNNADAEILFDNSRVILDSNVTLTIEDSPSTIYLEKGLLVGITAPEEPINILSGGASVLSNYGVFIVEDNYESYSRNLVSNVSATVDLIEGNYVRIVNVSGDLTVETGVKFTEITDGLQYIVYPHTEEFVEIDKEYFKLPFISKALHRSRNLGYDIGIAQDFEIPEITMIDPAEKIETTEKKYKIKFKSSKDGFYRIDEGNWKELAANKETSEEVSLNEGENTFKLEVKDTRENRAEVIIEIERSEEVTISWNVAPKVQSSGVYMEWKTSGALPGKHIYKVFKNGSFYRSFNVTEVNKVAANWVDENIPVVEAEYYVGIYSDSQELDRTSKYILNVSSVPEPPQEDCTITLSRKSSVSYNRNYDQKRSIFSLFSTPALAVVEPDETNVSWIVSSGCSGYDGFKLVWNDSGMPTYPESNNALFDSSEREGTVPPGEWYVRVCIYQDGSCSQYSNQLSKQAY